MSFGPRNLLSPVLQPFGFDPGGVTQPLILAHHSPGDFLHDPRRKPVAAMADAETGRPLVAITAGAVGSLLFYTYVYYWPVWIGAILLLLVFDRGRRRALLLTNVVTWTCSLPFWWTLVESSHSAGFANVLARHTSELGHVPQPAKVAYTIVVSLVFLVCVAIYERFGSGYSLSRRRVLLYFSAIFVAALAALNMEVIVGFNVESMLHFPNRLFQPFLTLTLFALASRPLLGWKHSQAALLVVGGLLLGLGMLRQVTMSNTVAAAHDTNRSTACCSIG